MIAIGAALGLALAAAPLLARWLRGPTQVDRLLATHGVFMLVALLLACLSVTQRAPSLLDAALALTLANAVLVIASVKALRRNSFQPAMTALDESAAP